MPPYLTLSIGVVAIEKEAFRWLLTTVGQLTIFGDDDRKFTPPPKKKKM